jgi:hypothetical protein
MAGIFLGMFHTAHHVFDPGGGDMRKLSMVSLILCLLLATTLIAGAVPSDKATLIAHYPLLADALDATGNNDAMTLTNAPFQDGGVFCNGIYPGGDPAASIVQTPMIAGWDPESFTASAEFVISEYPPAGIVWRSIFMCGTSWRWMGVDIYSDGLLGLRYNNSIPIHTDQPVSLDTWHEAMISYDGTVGRGYLYLDGEWVCEIDFVPIHHDFLNIATHNGASGRQFLGIFRELKVYDEPIDPTPVEELTWGAVKTLFR